MHQKFFSYKRQELRAYLDITGLQPEFIRFPDRGNQSSERFRGCLDARKEKESRSGLYLPRWKSLENLHR